MIETITPAQLQSQVKETGDKKQLKPNQAFIEVMKKTKEEIREIWKNENPITDALFVMMLNDISNDNIIVYADESNIGRFQKETIEDMSSSIQVETISHSPEVEVSNFLIKNKDLNIDINASKQNQVSNKIIEKTEEKTGNMFQKIDEEKPKIEIYPKIVKEQTVKDSLIIKNHSKISSETPSSFEIQVKEVDSSKKHNETEPLMTQQNKDNEKVKYEFPELKHDIFTKNKRDEHFKSTIMAKTAIEKNKNTFETGDISNAPQFIKGNPQNEAAKSLTNTLEIDKKTVIKHLVKKISLNLQEHRTEMKIQLEPESLGKMSIKLVVDKGVLNAKFSVDNQQVKNVIQNHVSEIKEIFQNQGYNVQGFSVSVGEEKNYQFQQNRKKPEIKLKKIKTVEEKELNVKYFSENLRTEFSKNDNSFNYLV